MTIYSYIEERYCPLFKRNVGVEYTQMSNGNVVRRCLSRLCLSKEEIGSARQLEARQSCLFHNFD